MRDAPTAWRGHEVRAVTADGIRFAHLRDGPDDGPLALLLCGFPDSPLTWRHLTPRLLEEGYRVVAPWSRGLGPSGPAPDGRADPHRLADDVIALHHALDGDERAVLIGHDWGAVAGQLAVARPDSPWRRAVLLAIPPLHAVTRMRPRHLAGSLGRLDYIAAMQLPFTGRVLAANLRRVVEALWHRWSPGYDPTAEELDAAVDTLRDRGALAHQVTQYRAVVRAFLRGRLTQRPQRLTTPTLFLHGEQDGCMDVRLARAAARTDVPGQTIEILPQVGHFLHLEAPGEVHRATLRHLAS